MAGDEHPSARVVPRVLPISARLASYAGSP